MKCLNCPTMCEKTDYGFWRCPKCGFFTGGKTMADWLRFDDNKKGRKRFHAKRHKYKKEELMRDVE